MTAPNPSVQHYDDSDIIFQEASPAQREQSWRLNSISWRGPMSLEQYIDREVYLGKHELCSNGRCKYWVLSSAQSPMEIFASCETLQKSVLAADENGLQILKGYAIASVHTNPKYRRQGMAVRLMESLKKWFDSEGETDLSVLYSDIGPEYYSKLGWKIYKSQLTFIEILHNNSDKIISTAGLLDKDTIRQLCDKDVANIAKKLLNEQSGNSVILAFEPSFAQVSWHFSRAEYTGKTLLGQVPQNFGAITQSKESWIYWFHDFRAGELLIQRLVLSDKEEQPQRVADIVELLKLAILEVEAWGLKQVIIWNPPSEDIVQALSVLEERYKDKLKVSSKESDTTSIPSLRLKEGKDPSNVKWLYNEYYAWC